MYNILVGRVVIYYFRLLKANLNLCNQVCVLFFVVRQGHFGCGTDWQITACLHVWINLQLHCFINLYGSVLHFANPLAVEFFRLYPKNPHKRADEARVC